MDSQAERAELSLTVPIPVGEGFNFAASEAMIDCGRRTALQRLPQIRAAQREVLAPRGSVTRGPGWRVLQREGARIAFVHTFSRAPDDRTIIDAARACAV